MSRFAAIACIIAATGGCTRAPRAPIANTPPTAAPVAFDPRCGADAAWNLDEMAREGFHDLNFGDDPPYEPAEVRILAWDRNARQAKPYDEALLWIHRKDGGYSLMYVYRHPQSPTNATWELKTFVDTSTMAGDADYAQPPTHADFEAFLDTSAWVFESADGFVIDESNVCADVWQATFGEPPWHAFKK